jgi:Gp49-like protein DUF891
VTCEIVFFEDREGKAPVLEWLDSQPDEIRGKLLAAIAKLQQHGPTLPFPYSSQIEGRMRELRTQLGKTNIVCCISSMKTELPFCFMAFSRTRLLSRIQTKRLVAPESPSTMRSWREHYENRIRRSE